MVGTEGQGGGRDGGGRECVWERHGRCISGSVIKHTITLCTARGKEDHNQSDMAILWLTSA